MNSPSTRRGSPFDPDRALQLLRDGSGLPDAEFREGQEDAIRRVVDGSGRHLIVQRTGWGKSFVYFIAIKLLRDASSGPALLISPLLALMRNQLAAAERMGVRAATINSDNQEEWTDVEASITRDEVDILLISPERLANERFREEVLVGIAGRLSLLVIDEAHCISDWGHDFRPHYRLLERIVRSLPQNLRVLATTATANLRVMEDLKQILGPDLSISRGGLNRPSLKLQTIRQPRQAERLAWLAEHVPQIPGSGVIYTLTKRDARQVSAWLKHQGVSVEAYTGETGKERAELERALLENRVKALVATTALGMGFDKPDLAFVIHYQAPGSVVTYYQQVGRAGRALHASYGVLLAGDEDALISNYFIDNAFPSRDEVAAVLSALEAAPHGLSMPELLGVVNVSRGRVEKALQLLSLEAPAPIAKQETKWQLTAASLGEAFWARADRLTRLRQEELEQMREYVALQSGHMDFLIRALDGDPDGVASAVLPDLPSVPAPSLVAAATTFLHRTSIPIEPRKKWPDGGMPAYGLSGNIPADHRAREGKALCLWGDAGWGGLVSTGKYQARRFSDDLVAACIELYRDWNPTPSPRWVTCIPSRRHPDLVPDFARRLAGRLGIPFRSALAVTQERPEQKSMANGIQQARNVDGAFTLDPTAVHEGPCLLVDDVVDSRWTLTVGSWLLRAGGVNEVWPLALAKTGRGQ